MNILKDIDSEKKEFVNAHSNKIGKLTMIFKATFFIWDLLKNIFIIYLMIKTFF